ncbi:hypothetical protein [Leadbettera azotonutricia]|uniref:Uncharacterized protein n=1 Tax=Leadbettera azotonutricia (strain ATCC BAA-888 / DSM 13862 / ZAS-9) TaxID=545695 RepID=F5YF62_LEAAZ|nr:hypothetical protein [Leadbettera azotonutricia]AEF80427.1 hypothetical protein TREAZ_2501 [Leadbettera azotonutricia ZAS-9]
MQYYNRIRDKIDNLDSAAAALPKLPETLAAAHSVQRLLKNALEKIDSGDLSRQMENLLFNLDMEIRNPSPTFNGKDEPALMSEYRNRSDGEVW